MSGVTMEEMREWMTWNHEIEFTYKGKPYVMQPEVHGEEHSLVIWDVSPDAARLCAHPIPPHGGIPSDCIDAVLNDKCFDGKSFMEIESEVTVDAIM